MQVYQRANDHGMTNDKDERHKQGYGVVDFASDSVPLVLRYIVLYH